MSKVLITGITGSLGQTVMKKLLGEGHTVIGYSRDELKQSQIPAHQRFTAVLGDIRDQRRLIETSRGVDTLYHFAALKRIEFGENNPDEFKMTNVEGTDNVLGAQRVNGIKRVVLSSTDKACYPVNVYGATKLLAERSVLRNQNNVVCRYGNVLASRGSVVPMFVESLLRERAVYITDPRMTRFFITLEGAAAFVTNKGSAKKGGLFTPDIKGCRIIDLANAVSVVLGLGTPTIKIIGTRPGEKLHECLRTEFEGGDLFSNTCEQFTPTEIVALIEPIVNHIIGKKPEKKLKVRAEAHA